MRQSIYFDLKAIQKYVNPLNHPKISLLIILIAGFVLKVLKLVTTGIWVDEGIYFYEAGIILEGKVPYRDFFKPKPLGMIYIISFLFYFTDQSAIAARILTALVGLLTSYFVYLLGKEMYHQKIGFLAAIFYTFDPLVILFSYHVYMETYATIFLVLSAYFAVIAKKRDDMVNYLISGILIGISFFMKQPGIIMALVIAPFIFYSPFQKKSLHKRFLNFSILIVGILIVLLLIFAYHFLSGLLDEFIYYNFTFHSKYTGSAAPLSGRINLVRHLILDNIILWVAGVFAIPIFLKNRRDVDILTLSFFLITFMFLISLLDAYTHYFVQSTPPLCILASYSLNEFFSYIFGSKIRIIGKYFLLGALILLISGSIFLSSRSYVYARTDYASLGEQQLVADYIKQRTSPDEYIFSSYPAYYFLSERKCPSRYIFLAISTLEVEDVDFPEVLQDKKVRYVILTNLFVAKRYNEKIDVIIDYIEAHYQIEKTFSFRKETILIYRSMFW